MSICRCVASSSYQLFFILEWYVLMSFRITISLGKTEVNGEDIPDFFPESDQKVLRFNITMYVVFKMDVLEIAYDLITDHKNSFKRESFPADLK